MKRIATLVLFCLLTQHGFSAILWSQDFTSGTTGFYATSNMTRNAGGTWACASSNYVYYTNSTYAYVTTNTINVPQGKGIRFSFDSRRVNLSAGTVQVYYLVTGACSWDRLYPNNNGWVLWGTITPNTSSGSSTGCTNQVLSLESHVAGGQNISVLMYFPSASGTNWISIDNLVVDDAGPVSAPVPNINTTTYTENITTNKWYGPVTTGNYSTVGITIPYHSYRSASSAYTYLWTGGSGGSANHSGDAMDYFAAFYTGFEFCNSSGASQIITKELNTSSCPNPEIKFAYKAKYPCTAGNYDNTFDESYDLYAPELYTSTGQGYNWVQRPVNYYFPDGLWHFACYSLPSASNIKIRLARGGSCSSPVEGVDNITVFCRNCSISSLSAGTISGEASPDPNTEYTYTITSTAGATYYKWMVRAIDSSPPIIIDAACPNGTNPCIVSGQGTQSVVINFGSLTNVNYRVICIPYDSDPGTWANPTDACYASLALFPTTTNLPVELSYFVIEQKDWGVALKWQTNSETNNDYFRIECGQDAVYFQEIGRIQGAGSSNHVIDYSFNVEKLHFGPNYFRLAQVDFDGAEHYSRVISVINESPEEHISITSENNSISIETAEEIRFPLSLQVFDRIGRCVLFSDNLLIPSGGKEIFELPEVPEGIYYIRLNGTGVSLSKSLFIKK